MTHMANAVSVKIISVRFVFSPTAKTCCHPQTWLSGRAAGRSESKAHFSVILSRFEPELLDQSVSEPTGSFPYFTPSIEHSAFAFMH